MCMYTSSMPILHPPTHNTQYEEPEYRGCVTQVISAPLLTNHDHIPSHDPYHCLECSIPLVKPYHGVGMSISSNSLSSHFLYAPPAFPGGSSPQIPRSRAHTLDNTLTATATKLQDHHRSASATLPTNTSVVNGNPNSAKSTLPQEKTLENGKRSSTMAATIDCRYFNCIAKMPINVAVA